MGWVEAKEGINKEKGIRMRYRLNRLKNSMILLIQIRHSAIIRQVTKTNSCFYNMM